jgi:peptidoglycan/LPS O-acetylase OafA/YrhL
MSPLVYLGRLSYSLYLWHFVVFHALTASTLGVSYAASAVVRITATLMIAMASYHLVEQPVLRLKKKLGQDSTRLGKAPSRHDDIAGRAAIETNPDKVAVGGLVD